MTMREAEEKASPLCSVVCTTYNHAKFSRASIQSIADQDYPNIEIIVVDDGSTDGNVDIVRDALEASGRPYTLLAQNNTGNVPMNVNRGLAAARGEYVSLTSLDDILLPSCISTKIKRLETDQNLTFVANIYTVEIDAGDNVLSEATSRAGLNQQIFSCTLDLLEYDFKSLGAFYVQGAVFRLSVIRAFGGYDEDLIGDDIIFRTKLLNYMVAFPNLTFAFEDNAGVAYRKHGGNIHANLLRQIKCLVQWKERYYKDRPFPNRMWRSVNLFFKEGLLNGRRHEIEQARNLHHDIDRQYLGFRSTWKARGYRFRHMWNKVSGRV